MPQQRRSGAQPLGKPRAICKGADEIKFVIGTAQDYEWAREIVLTRNLAAALPGPLFLGVPSAAAPAGQIAAPRAGGPGPHLPPGIGREDRRRRLAGPVSTANAQIHLAARTRKAFSRMNAATQRVLDLLRAYESPNMLAIEPDGSWPIVWERARGTRVWDAEGRRYLDLTAAFGVAAAGHANPRVVAAGQRQMRRLPHAMGDVHPHALKARLARELSRVTFERWSGGRRSGKTIFNNSGFEAVEAALKTALLATGRPGHRRLHRRLSRAGIRRAQRHPSPVFPRSVSAAIATRSAIFVPFPANGGRFAGVERRINELLDRQTLRRRSWSSRSRRAAASTCRPPQFLPLLARPVRPNTARCSSWTRFTPALAARENGSPARKAAPCRT